MRKRFLCKVFSVVVLFLSFNCLAHGQEEQTSHNISTQDYRQVLDSLFPLDALLNIDWEFVTIVRYQPNFEAESQYVMIGRNGYVEVIEYKSLDGNLFKKLNNVPGVENMTLEEMATKVRVGRREFRIPFPLAQRWRRDLLASVHAYMRPKTLRYVPPATGVDVKIADATTYELWDASWSWDLHFDVQGGSTHKGAPPLAASFIKAMNVVRRDFAKRQ